MQELRQEQVDRIISLSVEARNSRPAIETITFSANTNSSPSVDLLELTQSEKKLSVYIHSLNNNELAEIAAIMWVGKDYENIDDINNQWSLLVNDGLNNKQLAQYILGKTPLSDYLQDGMKKLMRSNISFLN